MIYLFHGSDSGRVREKAFAWIAAARAKEPNLAYVRLAREELSSAALEEAALSGGLFVKRLLVLIDDPFASLTLNNAEETQNVAEETQSDVGHAMSYIEEAIEMLATSDNAIVILAPKLAAAKAKKIAAKAAKTYAYEKPPSREAARGFNSALVNALAARSREKLWLEVVRSLRAGDAPEMLHGLLHWKARDLMQKGSRAWKPEESRALSLALIALLMDSRKKGIDLSLELERFALSI